MKILEAKEPRWANEEKTAIHMRAKFEHLVMQGYDFVPFLASPTDVEEHGRALFELAKGGLYGDVAAFDPEWKDH